MIDNDGDFKRKSFKRPRRVLPELTRLIEKGECELPDYRPIRNAVILQLSRGNAFECPNRNCRRLRICQRPAYKCHLAHHADLYDWDFGLPHCPRQAMYDEVVRQMREGKFTEANMATKLSEVVRAFQPELTKRKRWSGIKPDDPDIDDQYKDESSRSRA
jgi:hypothetical protein